ncbi:MAG: HrpE/YscL family type III secretion apparatus protein [Planctomycetota bacterium]|jgi:type III secretion protein L|nr:HrpE/YscL family type III secretion apparatus protein [Planctomycetota bacterium]
MGMLSLFPEGGLAPDPADRIIRAGDYAQFVAASELLQATRLRAEEIIRQAETAAEECRKKGYADGVVEGKAELADRLFEAVSGSVEQLSSMEGTLVKVVLQSLRTILGQFDQGELVTQVVRHALRLVRDEKKVILRVSSGEAETVEKRLADLVSHYPGMGRVDVVADSALAAGSCILETEIGVVDASLERQLASIEDNFRHHLEEPRS